VDDDDLFDLLTSIEERVPTKDKPGRFEREAGDLAFGEHGRASLLIAAGEHWQMRGAYFDARRCFQEALEDGDKAGPPASGPSLVQHPLHPRRPV
jgi:hypothetical protein